MKLQQALDQIVQFAADEVIFAKKPWDMDSDAAIANYDPDYKIPKALSDRGLAYFLEVSVANEVLEVFEGRNPTLQQRRDLLLHYAQYDAYPDWVYEK